MQGQFWMKLWIWTFLQFWWFRVSKIQSNARQFITIFLTLSFSTCLNFFFSIFQNRVWASSQPIFGVFFACQKILVVFLPFWTKFRAFQNMDCQAVFYILSHWSLHWKLAWAKCTFLQYCCFLSSHAKFSTFLTKIS